MVLLELHPRIDQTGTYNYNASNVVGNTCLLSKNEFSITDTLNFPVLVKGSTNDESYEDVSQNAEKFVYKYFCLRSRLYFTQNSCS